jgi:hypothetical protein
MKFGLRVAMIVVLMSAVTVMATGQQKTEKPANPVHLELTAEVAATTEEGYPAALRVTVKNVGNMAVDMSMPVLGCLPQGGHLFIHLEWWPDDPNNHSSRGWGEGCGEGDMPSLTNRIRDEGIRLRPGEYITSCENIRKRIGELKPGTVEYWVEFVPPNATKRDLAELQQAGYIIPTEKIETVHQTFAVQ